MVAIAARYRRRADAFEREVAAVRDDQWSNPSPCRAWNARDVVDHIVSMHGYMLRPVDRSLSPAPSVRQDPLAAFRAARADVEAVLDDPELARIECDTPGGRMTVEQHIDQVVSDDLVLHGWDLAHATGQDETMDPEDVARLWAITTAIPAELMEKYRTPGAFGPGVEVYGPEVKVPRTLRCGTACSVSSVAIPAEIQPSLTHVRSRHPASDAEPSATVLARSDASAGDLRSSP